jgi:hypothetical protein
MKRKRTNIERKESKERKDRLRSLGGATTPASAMIKCTKSWN